MVAIGSWSRMAGRASVVIPAPLSDAGGTVWGIAASLPRGLAVCRLDAFGELLEPREVLAEDLESPLVAQLGDGRLVAVAGGRIEVFECSQGADRHVGQMQRDPSVSVWGVFGGNGAEELWEVCRWGNGEVLVRWLAITV